MIKEGTVPAERKVGFRGDRELVWLIVRER